MIGTILDDSYRLLELIGGDEMGDVYLARYLPWDSICAVKLLNERCAGDPTLVQRFLDWGNQAQGISSPHLVQVVEVRGGGAQEGEGEAQDTIEDPGEGEAEAAEEDPDPEDGEAEAAETGEGTEEPAEDGPYYVATEYAQGMTLDQVIEARAPLSVDESVDLIRQALEGLAELHRVMVHGNLKPKNLIADSNGALKIMDCGIAKVAGAGISGSEDRFLGAPEYLSPEQIMGEDADERSDLYSLGAILFELLTGEPPFAEDSFWKTIDSQLQDPLPPLEEYRQDVPPELESVLIRALDKDPDERFRTAKEMQEALGAACGEA